MVASGALPADPSWLATTSANPARGCPEARKTRGNEAHLSAQYQEKGQEPRFQAQDVDAGRTSDHSCSQAQGPQQADGLSPFSAVTWRVTDRATFEALRHDGKRARSGSVSVVFLDDGGDRARVAYAVGRRVGGAVERNRLRRRLRSAVSVIESEAGLSPGAYLVAPSRETSKLEYEELVSTVHRAVRRVHRENAPRLGAESDRSATDRT
jgi:ribonuclease P protein component